MRSIRMIRWTVLPFAVLLVSAGMANAAARPATHTVGRPGNNHAPAHVVGRLPSATSGTYIYAEDGTCPDGIDVLKASGAGLTNIQNVQDGCSGGTQFGARHLAVVKGANNCLILSNDGFAGEDQGTVDSFTIDPSTGMLSTSPVSSVFVGGWPQDLQVSGSTVYESDSNPYASTPTIDELTVGSGCALTLDSQNPTGSENDINIALSHGDVVSADYNSGNLVAYAPQSNHTLSETVSDQGQLSGPDGVAAAGNFVFTGQVADPAYEQGNSFNGSSFTALTGSPATTGLCNGAATAVSATNRLVLQANQCQGTISWYTVGPFTAGGAASLQDTNSSPTEITLAGNIALVAGAYNGDVEACSLATSGVSNCRTVATLTGAGSGYSGSTAIF